MGGERERVSCLALKWSTNRAFVLLSLFVYLCVCACVCLRAVGTQLISAITRLFCFVVIFLSFFFCYTFFPTKSSNMQPNFFHLNN